ncbi:hypothetical protein C8R47DRAFT_913308, partial [Mycena vitilis]
ESATVTRIDALGPDKVGHKFRIVGRMRSIDMHTGTGILLGQNTAILVDVSSCLDPAAAWSKDRFCTICTIGYLEK